MKIDFGLQKYTLSTVGIWMERIGFFVFLFTFWMSGGFFLGGDGVFMGPFLPELQVIFPWCGIGILLLFFGRILNGRFLPLSLQNVTFVLLFLGFFAIDALFSLKPEVSILFLIIWSVAFLAGTFGDLFFLRGNRSRTFFFLSLLIGFLSQSLFPHWHISSEILGVGLVLSIVFLFHETYFRGRIFLLFIALWMLAEMGLFALCVLAFFLILSAKAWTPSLRRNIQRHEIILPLIFLSILLIWEFFIGKLDIHFIGGWPNGFASNITRVFFGVGEGQYLTALQDLSSKILLPENFVLPSSGLILTFFEKGLLGTAFLLGLLGLPFWISEKKRFLPSLLFLGLLLCTTDMISTENGILFFMTFLLAQPPLMRFSNQI
ncbi:hypothetical protein K9L27_04460 [Candidatus Gracilibacteria bacterium]|nr:hypothetical protein [Candidatus Gracilibacteria bacterium]